MTGSLQARHPSWLPRTSCSLWTWTRQNSSASHTPIPSSSSTYENWHSWDGGHSLALHNYNLVGCARLAGRLATWMILRGMAWIDLVVHPPQSTSIHMHHGWSEILIHLNPLWSTRTRMIHVEWSSTPIHINPHAPWMIGKPNPLKSTLVDQHWMDDPRGMVTCGCPEVYPQSSIFTQFPNWSPDSVWLKWSPFGHFCQVLFVRHKSRESLMFVRFQRDAKQCCLASFWRQIIKISRKLGILFEQPGITHSVMYSIFIKWIVMNCC